MKTIMINGLEIYGELEPHGPQRFGVEVVGALDQIDLKNFRVEVVVPKELIVNGMIPHFKQIKVTGVDYNLNRFKRRFLFSKFRFSKYVRENGGYGIDLVLSYPFSDCKAVCLFDCIVKEGTEEYNSLHAKIWRWKYLFFEKNAIQKANIIFTISERSKNKIQDNYNVQNEKIVVVGCGYEHIKSVVPDYSIIENLKLREKKYFFSGGVGSTRKNFKWIVDAAINNPQSLFVIAGACGKQILEAFDVNNIKNIIIAGFVTNEQYRALLEYCVAYIQPSFDEGFGIPPLEALALGKKAIVSDIPIFREIYGESVYYIDPYDYCFDKIEEIVNGKVGDPKYVLEKYKWKSISERILGAIVNDIERQDNWSNK